MFQSARPRGARPALANKTGMIVVFQSARPRGARPSRSRRSACFRRFNPRAREGRDRAPKCDSDCGGVSIRAPARGATRRIRQIRPMMRFQSARPRGARHQGHRSQVQRGRSFNPRAREGRDVEYPKIPEQRNGFNPRAREGRDDRPYRRPTDWRCFNPRARGGRGAGVGIGRGGDVVSIRAPARGATTFAPSGAVFAGFQSARPRGARLAVFCPVVVFGVFQSARPRGARRFSRASAVVAT